METGHARCPLLIRSLALGTRVAPQSQLLERNPTAKVLLETREQAHHPRQRLRSVLFTSAKIPAERRTSASVAHYLAASLGAKRKHVLAHGSAAQPAAQSLALRDVDVEGHLRLVALLVGMYAIGAPRQSRQPHRPRGVASMNHTRRQQVLVRPTCAPFTSTSCKLARGKCGAAHYHHTCRR